MPLPGDDIKIKYQIPDFRTDRFVRAYVLDHNDAPLAGSPVDLTHISKGLYTNNDLTFPDVPSVTVQVEVFKDPTYTQRARTYAATVISIEKTLESTTTVKASSVDRIFAVVRDDKVEARLSDPIAKALVDDPQVRGQLTEDQSQLKESDDQLNIRSE